jgi:hypothetical protein
MITSLIVEARKLKGSLALVLCLVAPTLVSSFLGLVCLRHATMSWREAMTGTTGLWSFFVLPMTVTALSALVAQIEHGPRAWDHILSLPVPRWRLFAAKAVVVMVLLGLMSVLLAIEIRVVGGLLRAFAPTRSPIGAFPWTYEIQVLTGMWAASLFMTMIQLWVALRFRSFVAPLTLGIGGTFFAVMASGAGEGVYIPWFMPLNIIATDPARASQALQYGVIGGALTFLAMLLHLSRREA